MLAGDHRLALRPTTPRSTPKTRSAAATWCSKRWTNRATSPQEQTIEGQQQALPSPSSIEPPTLESKAPYFTAYLRQQLVERYGASKAFFGGLKVKSTLDLQLQEAAEEAVSSYLGYSAGDRLGGRDRQPQRRDQGDGRRPRLRNQALQPGDPGAPPAGLLDQALHAADRAGRGDLAGHRLRIPSEQRTFHFGKHGEEVFVVHNDEDSYLGSCSIVCATTYSDNSIYAQLGLEGLKGKTVEDRTRSIAEDDPQGRLQRPDLDQPGDGARRPQGRRLPARLGLRLLTIGNNGDRVSGTLAPSPGDSPVAYTEVTDKDGNADQGRRQQLDPPPGLQPGKHRRGEGDPRNRRLQRHRHQRPDRRRRQWGKTGTTEENGDAWFCGGIADEVTACVWVGYPDTTTPMTTLYNGGPVMGGTFPALIWASVISAWQRNQSRTRSRSGGAQGGQGSWRRIRTWRSGRIRIRSTGRRRRIRSPGRAGNRGRRSRTGPRRSARARRSSTGSRSRSSARRSRPRRRRRWSHGWLASRGGPTRMPGRPDPQQLSHKAAAPSASTGALLVRGAGHGPQALNIEP